MPYIIFDRNTKNITETVSLLTLTPASKIRTLSSNYYDGDISSLSPNSSPNLNFYNKEQLINILICIIIGRRNFKVLHIDMELNTDKYLLDFGEKYIGTIRNKYPKKKLVENIYKSSNFYIISFISNRFKGRESLLSIDKFEDILNDNEINDIKKAEADYTKSIHKIFSKIDNRIKAENTEIYNYIERNF